MTTQQLQLRKPNWLPLPGVLLRGEPEQEVDEGDAFSKGEVVKFYPHQGYGFVRNERGENLFFHLSELDFVGPKNSRNYLNVGLRVGYDVAWTSRGLHISKLKIY